MADEEWRTKCLNRNAGIYIGILDFHGPSMNYALATEYRAEAVYISRPFSDIVCENLLIGIYTFDNLIYDLPRAGSSRLQTIAAAACCC